MMACLDRQARRARYGSRVPPFRNHAHSINIAATLQKFPKIQKKKRRTPPHANAKQHRHGQGSLRSVRNQEEPDQYGLQVSSGSHTASLPTRGGRPGLANTEQSEDSGSSSGRGLNVIIRVAVSPGLIIPRIKSSQGHAHDSQTVSWTWSRGTCTDGWSLEEEGTERW